MLCEIRYTNDDMREWGGEKLMQIIKTDLGEINIAKETIGSIVNLNLADVKGVIGSRKTIVKEITDRLRGNTNKDELDKSSSNIKVEIKGNKPSINLYVVIKYGVRIPDIAWDIQSRIKKDLAKKLNSDIDEINVHVQGIQFPKKTQSRKDLVTSNLFIKIF